jgi:hypothetical protein
VNVKLPSVVIAAAALSLANRDQIHNVGASTVYPFSARAARAGIMAMATRTADGLT